MSTAFSEMQNARMCCPRVHRHRGPPNASDLSHRIMLALIGANFLLPFASRARRPTGL